MRRRSTRGEKLVAIAALLIVAALLFADQVGAAARPWQTLEALAASVLGLEANDAAHDARLAELESRVATLERQKAFRYCVKIAPKVYRCTVKPPPDYHLSR
jgi:hypothetical protein